MEKEKSEEYKIFVEKRLKEYKDFKKELKELKKYSFDTICNQGAFTKKMAYDLKSIVPCANTSSSSPFLSVDEMAAVLSYSIPGFAYTRIINPTNYLLELQMAMLEGYKIEDDTEALLFSSGMSAIFMAVFSLVENGDNIISSNRVYGGTFQLFDVQLKKMGVEVRFVENPENLEEWKNKIDEKTKLFYVESPSNPGLFIADIKNLADLAHLNNIPLIVDSTLASPVLNRPLEHGADIVIHSISKVLGASGNVIGGCLISKNNIITKSKEIGLKENFAEWVRKFPYRDIGPAFSPESAAGIINDMRTLKSRVKTHSASALAVAEFLEKHPKITKVNYPGLKNFSSFNEAQKYLKIVDDNINAYGFLLSFEVKGNMDDVKKVCENLKIGHMATDLGKSCTVFTWPAGTTHFQLGEEARIKAGISNNLIRYSVGLEDTKDLIKDLDQALSLI